MTLLNHRRATIVSYSRLDVPTCSRTSTTKGPRTAMEAQADHDAKDRELHDGADAWSGEAVSFTLLGNEWHHACPRALVHCAIFGVLRGPLAIDDGFGSTAKTLQCL